MRFFITILFILVFSRTFSQSFPQPQKLGSKQTYVYTDGTFLSNTGFTFGLNYADTATANASAYISSTPGILIRVNDTLWLRNFNASKWLLVGSSGGGGGTVTGAIQGTSLVGANVQLGGASGALASDDSIYIGAHSFRLINPNFYSLNPNVSTTFRIDSVNGQRLDFENGYGGAIGFNIASNVTNTTPGLGFTYNAVSEVAISVSWKPTDKHLKIEARDSMRYIGIETENGTSTANFGGPLINHITQLGLKGKIILGQTLTAGQTLGDLDNTGSTYLRDSLTLKYTPNGTVDSVLAKDANDLVIAVAKSSITSGVTFQQALINGSTLTQDNTVLNVAHSFSIAGALTQLQVDDNNGGDINLTASDDVTINAADFNLQQTPPTSNDTTNNKILIWNSTTKEVGIANWSNGGGGSGGTPAGNTSDIQINRGGAFATPASDSFNYTQSAGLQLKGGLITMATSGSGTIIIKSTTGGGILFGPLAGQNLVNDVTSTDFIGIGASALANQHAGVRSNIAIGKVALANDTSGGSNVAVGANIDTRSGQFNTLIGDEINQNGTTNGNNSALGYRSQNACTTCHDNTSEGKQSLEALVDGINNTAMGQYSAGSVIHGNGNIGLGFGALYSAGDVSSQLSINNNYANTNAAIMGQFNSTANKVGINYPEATSMSYTLQVNGNMSVATIDSTATGRNMLYQDADGRIRKTALPGSGTLSSVGTGYDVAVTGTLNAKRLQAGYGMLLDSSTTGVIKAIWDSATAASYVRSTVPGAASATWNLTGNASVTTAQFLGTTDANKIRFRTNNTERGYWDSTGTTLFIGAPTYVNNTYGLIIQSPTNNSSQAIKVYSNNLSSSAELGFGRLLFSSNADIAMSAGTLKLNSPNGTKVGDGNTPTAFLHIVPGTASASKGQLKFSEGVVQTTGENGVMNYDTTGGVRALKFDVGTTHYTIPRTLTGSATLDFGSTAGLSTTDLSITVTGASDADEVALGVPNGSEPAGTNLYGWRAWVSSANTVTVRLLNFNTVTAIDPASGTFRVTVIKH